MRKCGKVAGVVACICFAVLIGMPIAVQAVTGNFTVRIDDGAAINQTSDFKETNVDRIEFNHLDTDFSVSYRYNVFYSDDNGANYEALAANVAENTVLFADYYRGEGIYRIAMQGLDRFASPDSGYFNNLIQSTASAVKVDEVLNDSDTIVENPELVVVGRDAADEYGEYSYSWEILDSEGTVVLAGTDVQPEPAALAALPEGTYLIRNTVTEPIAADFGGGFVSDTTEGAFVLLSANEPSANLDPEPVTDVPATTDNTTTNSVLPNTGASYGELAVLGGSLFTAALIIIRKVMK